MPVKKRVTPKNSSLESGKKSARGTSAVGAKKRKKTVKISKQQRKDIKQAANSLPSFIIERVPFAVESPKPPVERKEMEIPQPKKKELNPSAYNSQFEQQKRKLLWFVVGTIMIFIVSLWVVNVRTQVTDAGFNFGSEEKLWQAAKEDFQSMVKTPQLPITQTQDTLLPEEEEKIKQILAENLILLSATSTTSTPKTATSTNFTTSTLE